MIRAVPSSPEMGKDQPPSAYKYFSLVTLTLQNAVLALSINYSRTRSGLMFTSSTAVLCSEIVKFMVSLGLVFKESGGEGRKCLASLRSKVWDQPFDTLKVAIPAFAYIVQNNLLYVAASHLDAATYQVTFQLKILTTAVFSVCILQKKLRLSQWVALVLLLAGVALVQLAQTSEPKLPGDPDTQNRLVGLFAAFGAAWCSGFGGIYFEKILKGSPISIWMRNVQLALCSIPIGLLTCYINDARPIRDFGFFYGYDGFVVYLIILQACGGMLVAMVVKYADNLLKCFATSLAIVIACAASILFLDFKLTAQFTAGTSILIFSIFLYGYEPKSSIIIAKTDGLVFPKF